MVALGYSEELVGKLVLGYDSARRVRRADGEHGGRAFPVLHAAALMHYISGLSCRRGLWECSSLELVQPDEMGLCKLRLNLYWILGN